MSKKLFVLILFIILIQSRPYAQDHLYSQFYNQPNYLNPALNGQFEGKYRMDLIYRKQWINIPGPLNYFSFSSDINISNRGGGMGLGLMFTNSSEGTAHLSKTNFSAIYSYSIEFENSVLSFGLQAGITNRNLDHDKLVFLNQLTSEGIIPGSATSGTYPEFRNKFFFDCGSGVNLVIANFMIGMSGQHINQPDESLTGSTSKLPVRLNGYASLKIPTTYDKSKNSPSIIPTIVASSQAGVKLFDAGAQYKIQNLNIGLWYRWDGLQHDAMALSLTLNLFGFGRKSNDKMSFGLSYDANMSKLPWSKTVGTTEGSLSYIIGEAGETSDSYRCYDFK